MHSLVNEFVTKLNKRQIEGSKTTAKLTAELLRSFISQRRLPHSNQAGALIDAVKAVGEKLIAAKPVELAVGNVVRRVLHIIREEDLSLTTAAVGGLNLASDVYERHLQVSRLPNLLEKSLTVNQAKQIHCQIVVNDVQNLDPLLIRQILKCTAHYSGRITNYVKSILQRMRNPDCFSASCIIRSLSQHRQFRDAIDLYSESHASGIFPNTFAVSSALRS